MFSRNRITKSTGSYSDNIERLKTAIADADAIVIGAGAGLSTSAGLTYSGERFEKHFADFHQKYGITDMYSGGFYPFKSPEEFWAWWSRHIYVNRYMDAPEDTYARLLDMVKSKDYFVLTTNVDHCFQKAGFDKKRLFYTQGDYGLFQCSVPCCNETFDNEEIVHRMFTEQENMKIPSELIPKCPNCGKPLTLNLRVDDKFVEDWGWLEAADRYSDFLKRHNSGKVVYLELGVGANTPVIIKYPFWRLTAQNPNATYVCINKGEALCPGEIERQSICIDSDINKVLGNLRS